MNMYRQKRYDECIKEVKSKLKQNPNSLHLLNYQAMAYTALKNDREALRSYQKIIKKDPSLAGPYYNKGIILKRNGRTEEAIDNYKKAISLKPDYVQAYNNLGVLYKDNENYENAIKMFTKAVAIQPDHQNSYYNIALIKEEQGLAEEAVEFLLKLLDLNPDHNDAKALLKRYFKLNRKYMLRCYDEAIKINPKKPNNYYNRAITFKEAEKIDEAEDDYRRAIDLDPKHIGSQHNLALIHEERGQVKEALNIIKNMLKKLIIELRIYRYIGLLFEKFILWIRFNLLIFKVKHILFDGVNSFWSFLKL